MPIFFQQDIDGNTRLGIWKIEEDEAYFLQSVLPQRNVSHPHKKLQHLAGRYLLRYLFPDFPIELIRVADTRKPFLENEAYHFSISHCGNYAAAIVSRTERVGIDIELFTQKVERIRNKFLDRSEIDLLKPETTIPQLTLMWCCKEAVFKWWSYGGVDFSERIRLQPFELQSSDNLSAHFISGNQTTPLTIHYALLDQLCLAWLKTSL